jgi:SAM-dependent methyltransferase
MTTWNPSYLEGVDLGDSVLSAEHNLKSTAFANWKVTKADLTEYRSDGFDVVYCIGVLHHLKDPTRGLDAVIRNTKPGGRFHAWVYAREGNGGVIWIVDPIRKIASRLPWWLTKYVIATPLVIPFYIYSKTLAWLQRWYMLEWLPLYRYALWISPREFAFFRHVAFDQLVTPQTAYISKSTIEAWLKSNAVIDPRSTYIIMRNGNSWKFGGQVII